MITAFLKKYLSIIFILATFMGVFHQHNDLKPHTECKLYTLQSILENINIPTEIFYLCKINTYEEAILTPLCSCTTTEIYYTFNPRAPPKIS